MSYLEEEERLTPFPLETASHTVDYIARPLRVTHHEFLSPSHLTHFSETFNHTPAGKMRRLIHVALCPFPSELRFI